MHPPFRFQLISDLHLETPLPSPSYPTFTLPIHAPNLFLLGDTGQTTHPQLFTFLTTLLHTHPSLRIFYILGNHEAYHTTLETSIAALSAFEAHHGTHRFIFMHRRRVDIGAVSILGCTLWTHIRDASLLSDFDEDKGIWERSVEQHNLDHARDVMWLNENIASISPERDVIVLTHHSPTIDRRANHTRHKGSSANEGFRSDLSREECWRSRKVRVWAFGHTHYSCRFYEEGGGRGKLVLANQRGYGKRDAGVVVVEGGAEGWRVVVGKKETIETVGNGRGDRVDVGAGAVGEGNEMQMTAMKQEKKSTVVEQNPVEEKVGHVHPEPNKASRWRAAFVKIRNSLHKS